MSAHAANKPLEVHAEGMLRLAALAAELRPHLQSALLGILRAQALAKNLEQVASIFSQFKEASPNEAIYHLWWLAEAMVREVCSGEIVVSQEVNLLLRDLDRRVKCLIETGGLSHTDSTFQELVQRLTTSVSGSQSGLGRLQNRLNYDPPKIAPESAFPNDVDKPAPVDIGAFLQNAGFLKESLISVKDAIDRFARDSVQKTDVLRGKPHQLDEVADILKQLNMNFSADIIRRHSAILGSWITADDEVTDEQIWQLASELILVENSLGGVLELADGQGATSLSTVHFDGLDQHKLFMELEHRRAARQVMQEAINALGKARQVLEVHGPGDDRPVVWGDIKPILRSFSGVLVMLECKQALTLINRFTEVLKAWNAGEGSRDDGVFKDTVTEVMVTLEYYLELLGDAKQLDHDLLDHLQDQLSILEELVRPKTVQAVPEDKTNVPQKTESIGSPTITSVDGDESLTVNEARAEEWFESPTEKPRERFESEQEQYQKRKGADYEFELPAAVVEDVKSAAERTIPALPIDADELEQPDKQSKEIDPGSQLEVPVESDASSVDAEFVEVFFEEAREELASIRENVVAWRENSDNESALSSIRRSFHTLKGSGRMVEQFTIAEFAWGFEKLLNAVLEGQLAASPEIMEAVDRAQVALRPMVDGDPADRQEAASFAVLAEHAEALLRGEIPVELKTFDSVADTAGTRETPGLPEALPEKTGLSTVGITISEPVGKLPINKSERTDELAGETDKPMAAPASVAAVRTEQDQEMLAVFLEEAAEILDASEITLYRWSAERGNRELLNDLRREMHTLKGSSRMTGFMAIGNLAHALESLLDAIAADAIVVSTDAVNTLQRSLDGLSNMVARVREGIEVEPAKDLINDLNDLLNADSGESAQPEAKVGREQVRHTEKSEQGETVAANPERASPAVLDEQAFRPDPELLEVFLSEATEILNNSDATIQHWSVDQKNQELLNDLRRQLHTLKGSSRMAGFSEIGDLAHAMESLLDAIAKNSMAPTAATVNILQQALDSLNSMMAEVRNGTEITPAEDLIKEFSILLGASSTLPAVQPATVTQQQATNKLPGRAGPAVAGEDTIRVSASLLNNLVNQMGESSIYRARIDQGVGDLRFNLVELEQTISRLRQQLRRLEIETEAQILFRYEEDPNDYEEGFDPLELDRFSELQQLSRSLMEVVDDLTNIQNTLEDEAQDMNFLLDQQAKVNKTVQEGLMRTRMVRFSSAVPRLRRVVRQAAQELGKPTELVLHGSEAEVDRTVLENMVAPLEHVLRNCVSHGIESPEQRLAVGKPESGTITLNLRREGAELVIEVSDDGAGINFEAIKAKGEANGMLSAGQPATEQELIALLLQPGFSTAGRVTQISGRGVGMDVLNDAVKELRGALQIQSKRGKGANFTIRLPFSLAVTQALLVEVGGETYAIPLLSIEAVTRLKAGEIQTYFSGEAVHHKYGNHRYPVHSLGIAFGNGTNIAYEDNADVRPPALLFRSAEASAALQVDAVLGNQEIIVKPIGPQLHAFPGISGATVLGDGRVIVVLELAALVRNLSSQDKKLIEVQVLRASRQEVHRDRISAMVIDDSITMRKVTARFLERHNIGVTVAKDGVEAVALLEGQVPNFVIMDIEMPRMDGFEVVAHIRNQAHLQGIPIIMVTSRSGEKHRERAAKLGVDEYLIKPYQEEEMMQAIYRVLDEELLKLVG